jgi:hypothetical protein
MFRPWRHDGYVPEVDDDQLAALRRLRAVFGFVEVVEVIGHDSDDDPNLVTSGNASIAPPTSASGVVSCRLLPAGCRVFAACSPPAGFKVVPCP